MLILPSCPGLKSNKAKKKQKTKNKRQKTKDKKNKKIEKKKPPGKRTFRLVPSIFYEPLRNLPSDYPISPHATHLSTLIPNIPRAETRLSSKFLAFARRESTIESCLFVTNRPPSLCALNQPTLPTAADSHPAVSKPPLPQLVRLLVPEKKKPRIQISLTERLHSSWTAS